MGARREFLGGQAVQLRISYLPQATMSLELSSGTVERGMTTFKRIARDFQAQGRPSLGFLSSS
jgi:hypothetical protein